MRRLAEAGAGLQPCQGIDAAIVLMLVRASLDLDLDQVARIRTHDRRERIACERARWASVIQRAGKELEGTA